MLRRTRLSVVPVTDEEFAVILDLGKKKPNR
jgi:predicted RNA-binding protein with PUA-like domain